MIGAIVLAATVAAASPDAKQQTALGELAYTVGACERVMTDKTAAAMVRSMTGADIKSPTADHRALAGFYASMYAKGRSNPDRDRLTAMKCRDMLDEIEAEIGDKAR